MNEDNKYDAIKEIFSQKLENHQTSVDPSLWKSIDKSLNRKPSQAKRIIVTWISIAASLALIFATAFYYYNLKIEKKSENRTVTEKPSESLESKDDTPELVFDSAKDEIINVTKLKQKAVKKSTADSSLITKNDQSRNQSSRNNYANNEKKQEKDNSSSSEPEKKVFPQKQQEKQLTENQNGRQNIIQQSRKDDKGLLLSASIHTNGVFSVQQSPQYGVNVSNTKIYAPGDKVLFPNKALIPEGVDGEYLAPLSFGLTLRKNFNKLLGIETGLVYSFLSSNYRWNDSTPFDAKQQLHYIGIPVNGIIYIWNGNPKWDVYFSAGAMIEKGLWMNVVRNQYLPDKILSTTQKSNIDGWQCSLTSSIGIGYSFAEKMKLYLEPHLGYYFENDQPVNIRTNRPFVIGFGAGLQYSF